MAEEENLISRRPRRSTAGNRMELALAELALEGPQEPEEDNDFIVEKEEEDVFESDFASTDEEAVQEDVDEADKVTRDEERRERKTARARVERATAAAHARQRVTFNPESAPSQTKPKLPSKPKRRVSLGVVVDAETGQVIEGGAGTVGVKRQSQRRHTVMNTSATVNRIKDAEEKRAAIPKKSKTITRLPTQDELIARALDTEEGNIIEHKNYLRLEEEKRAKARVVKQAIEGPVLRWVSKKETIKVEVQLAPPPPAPPTTTAANLYGAKYSFVYTPGPGPGTVGSQGYSIPFYAYTPFIAQSTTAKPQATASSLNPPAPTASSSAPTSAITHIGSSTCSSNPQDNPSSSAAMQQQQQQPQPEFQVQPSSVQPQVPAPTPTPTPAPAPVQPVVFSYPPASPAPLVVHRTEEVCKNYVVHELSQLVPSKPAWNDTMTAMFGDHVRWDEVRVFMAKGRPLARPVRTCPITGQPAKYCDPRTSVPFANVGAYDVLTKILGRGYVWCSALECYVGTSKARGSGGDVKGSGAVRERAGSEGGDHDVEEERTTKRRRVGVGEGPT